MYSVLQDNTLRTCSSPVNVLNRQRVRTIELEVHLHPDISQKGRDCATRSALQHVDQQHPQHLVDPSKCGSNLMEEIMSFWFLMRSW